MGVRLNHVSTIPSSRFEPRTNTLNPRSSRCPEHLVPQSQKYLIKSLNQRKPTENLCKVRRGPTLVALYDHGALVRLRGSSSQLERGVVKKLFVFDLDGTLAESKSALSDELGALVHDLLGVMKVAVISGGMWSQFEQQLLANMPSDEHFSNLFLLPTCGTQLYRYENGWTKVYSEDLTLEERQLIIHSLERAFEESGLKESTTWGELIEDRGSQVTLSTLGQQAPLSAKREWDPDFAKRRAIIERLAPMLPMFAINMGGTTSIDVTKPGIDKAYGIAKLRSQLGVTTAEMLFAGDAIFEGGNDYPVQVAGVDSIQVRDPHETARVIQTVIACLGDGSRQIVSPGRIGA